MTLVAITTAGVVGFMSLITASSQAPEPPLASAKARTRACIPSQCRAKAGPPCAKISVDRRLSLGLNFRASPDACRRGDSQMHGLNSAAGSTARVSVLCVKGRFNNLGYGHHIFWD